MNHGNAFKQLVDRFRSDVAELSVAEVKKRQRSGESFILIDVREDHEWAAKRIPGAIHLSRGIIERDIEKTIPDRNETLILYCGGGYRSILSAANLLHMGYKNAISMDGGIRGWREAGHPIEEGDLDVR